MGFKGVNISHTCTSFPDDFRQLVFGQSLSSLMDYYGGGFPDYGTGGFPYMGGLDTQQDNPAAIRQKMVQNAKGQIGSDRYTKSSRYRIGKNKDKCHIFVFDVIQESDGVAPQRYTHFISATMCV